MKNMNNKHASLTITAHILLIALANLLYALSIVLFIIPSGLITGGTTGISLFLGRLTGYPVYAFVLLLNFAFFLLGFFFLGKKFALSTAASTILYPIALFLAEHLVGDYILTQDLFLCIVLGGLCIGSSIAIIVRLGASTGGIDIPLLILQKRYKIPLSISLYIADCLILILQATTSGIDRVLYGAILILVYSLVIDKLLLLGAGKMQLLIVSEYSAPIKERILSEIDRGVTIVRGQTGYFEKETEILLSIVSARELYLIEKLIHQIDPQAFVIISRVSQVQGKGFSGSKEYLSKHQ